jgi:catechol 2,3-dioxygenase-like lactoylglutathione lyase family enzyme
MSMEAKSRPVPRIVHVGFYCKDLNASIAWYKDVLGMEEQFGFPGRAQALGFGGNKEDHDIFLVQAPEQYAEPTPMHFDYETLTPVKGRVGFYHVAIDFGSFDAAMQAYGRALARNTELAKGVQHGDGRGIYVRDPDGNLVELFSFNGCIDDADALKFMVPYPNSNGRGGGFSLDVAATYENWRTATQGASKEPAHA